MDVLQREVVEAEAALEAIKKRRFELAEQIGVKRRAANNNTNLQQELKGTKETLKMAMQRVTAAKVAVAVQVERNAINQKERNAAAAVEAEAQRQRNITARAERNAQAAKNAKSIGWMNRMGNTLALKFNQTPRLLNRTCF